MRSAPTEFINEKTKIDSINLQYFVKDLLQDKMRVTNLFLRRNRQEIGCFQTVRYKNVKRQT